MSYAVQLLVRRIDLQSCFTVLGSW